MDVLEKESEMLKIESDTIDQGTYLQQHSLKNVAIPQRQDINPLLPKKNPG